MVTNVFLENSIYFIYLNINENSREPNKCTRAFIGKYLGVFCLKSPPPHRLLKESFSNFSIKEKNFGVKYFWGVKGGGWRGLQNRNKQKTGQYSSTLLEETLEYPGGTVFFLNS